MMIYVFQVIDILYISGNPEDLLHCHNLIRNFGLNFAPIHFLFDDYSKRPCHCHDRDAWNWEDHTCTIAGERVTNPSETYQRG